MIREKLLRIESDFFVAGCVFGYINSEWQIIKIAPILRYMEYWSVRQIKSWLNFKKWRYEWLKIN